MVCLLAVPTQSENSRLTAPSGMAWHNSEMCGPAEGSAVSKTTSRMDRGICANKPTRVSENASDEEMMQEINLTTAEELAPTRRFCCAAKLVLVLWLTGFVAHLAPGADFKLPLDRTNGWKFLNYRNIPTNTVHASSAGFEVGVTNSAAPAVFPLASQLQVTELRVSGRIAGRLAVPPGKQGAKGVDDYAIRVGLVEAGQRTLSWQEILIGADWVKKLFELAPPGTGINRIHFFNVGTDPKQLGRTRTHPMSDLMLETTVAVPDAAGRFAFTNRFARPIGVLAVWIACDGDDTKSSFAVTLNKVELAAETSPSAK